MGHWLYVSVRLWSNIAFLLIHLMFMCIAAHELIEAEKVLVLIGSHAWRLVVNVGNRAQVAVISLGASAISPTLAHVRWPFLIDMASNSSKEMKCVAAIVYSYNWRKVLVIYEDDA